MSKTTKICLYIIFVIPTIILIVEILDGRADSPVLAPRSEMIASICFESCKWDSEHQSWKHGDWFPQYFPTRSSCIDWCQEINE